MGSTSTAIVKTTAGLVEGSIQDGLHTFMGIPYAAPPVGERRWLAPVPPEPWEGVRDAILFGPVAMQNQSMTAQLMGDALAKRTQDEDCLNLNIYSPGLDDARRPVLFWIHGGAFQTGAGSMPVYNGSNLASRGDAVVVTINYRVNAFGFLRLSEVTGGGIPSTGNEGILDQIAALEWVRDNIAAFGGDPNNVTIFGESAGAMSVGTLLALPEARGLFHKAILQSGAASMVQTADRASRLARRFLNILDVSADDLSALRSLSAEQLLMAEREMQGGGLAWQPVVDGQSLPQQPLEAIANGSSDGIPVLIGTTLDEHRLWQVANPEANGMDAEGLLKLARYAIRVNDVEGMIEGYRRARAGRGESINPDDIYAAMATDNTFRIPAIRLADAHRGRENPVYSYIFTWPSPALGGRLGACHAVDIGFVFGTHAKGAMFWGEGPEADALSANVQDAWLAFARTGNPSCERLGAWPTYGARRETMMLGAKCFRQDAPQDEERLLWDARSAAP